MHRCSSVTSSLFRVFICTNIDPNNENTNEPNYYLAADVRIICYSAYWYKGVIYSCFLLIIYPIGIPMLYLRLMYRCKDELKNRSKINENEEKNHMKETNNNNNSTSNISININLDRMESINLTDDMNMSFKNLHNDSNNKNELSSYAKCLAMLWEPYNNEYWYWEVIECYRRIILISIVSIINPGSSLQSIVAVMFSLFFIKLYSHYTPYAARSDNILAEVGQFQVFFTFFISLIINNSLLFGITWKYVLDIILITSNLFVGILSIYFLIIDFNLLKRIPAITIPSIRSILDPSSRSNNSEEIHFISLEDTDNPELLYNSMKIESDSYNKQIKEIELSQEKDNLFDFDMNDFPDYENDDNNNNNDDDNDDNNNINKISRERTMRIRTPFN